MSKIPQYDLPSTKGKWVPAKPEGYIRPYYLSDEYKEFKRKKSDRESRPKANIATPVSYKTVKLEPADGVNMRQTAEAVWRDYIKWRKGDAYGRWLKQQWAKQHATCYWCSCSLRGRRHNVEHVIPISRGGTNEYKNLVLACPDCNKAKGRTLPKRSTIKQAKRFNRS